MPGNCQAPPHFAPKLASNGCERLGGFLFVRDAIHFRSLGRPVQTAPATKRRGGAWQSQCQVTAKHPPFLKAKTVRSRRRDGNVSNKGESHREQTGNDADACWIRCCFRAHLEGGAWQLNTRDLSVQASDLPSLGCGCKRGSRPRRARPCYEKSSGPKMLPNEIAFALSIDPGQVDRALSLDIPDDLRHRIFRRYRQQHGHVIGHQMPFIDLRFPL